MKKFYISDMHFGHKNIIKYDSRPFADVNSMDEYMIYRWNMAVSQGDIVYVLGDMFWKYDQVSMQQVLDRLNGAKHLILGNHDPEMNLETKKRFETISEIKEIKDGNFNVFMCHYPVHAWNNNWHQNSVHLYGHVHNTSEYDETLEIDSMIKEARFNQKGIMINVGVMMPWMYYTPKTLNELMRDTQ